MGKVHTLVFDDPAPYLSRSSLAQTSGITEKAVPNHHDIHTLHLSHAVSLWARTTYQTVVHCLQLSTALQVESLYEQMRN